MLTGSFLSLSWAKSLFGAPQTAGLSAGQLLDRPRQRPAVAFDDVAWEIQAGFGDTLQEIYLAADSVQRDFIDLSVPPSLLDPLAWIESGARLVRGSCATARFAVPTEAGCLAWRELLNKLEVYRLVRQAGQRIGTPPPGAAFPLLDLVSRSYALTPFEALWAVEGLGHDFAQSFWQRGEVPRRILSSGESEGLPAKCLLMLHAGIGLQFAQRTLGQLRPGSPPVEYQRVVREVLWLCHENSLAGDVGAAVESLGLVTRSFFAPLFPGVDRALWEIDPEAAAFFWHGVGRALYFLPINFLPCGNPSWRPFAMALSEAPNELARENALAGLSWAITLANMQQPEILALLLLRTHGAQLRVSPGFSNGVVSSILMRRDTTPDAALVASFLAYRPEPSDRELTVLWDDLVRRPAETALTRYYPALKNRGCLGEIFRYQPVDDWLERLQ